MDHLETSSEELFGLILNQIVVYLVFLSHARCACGRCSFTTTPPQAPPQEGGREGRGFDCSVMLAKTQLLTLLNDIIFFSCRVLDDKSTYCNKNK